MDFSETVPSVNNLIPLLFGLTISALCAAPVSLANIKARKEAKPYPSLFQVWNGFLDTSKTPGDNLKYQRHYIAENDLFMTGPWYYGLEFESSSAFSGEGTVLKPESILRGLSIRDSLLKLNPNIILIGEVRYYDAQFDFLPENSPFWVKDAKGKPLQNPDCCPGYGLLDWRLPAYQKQVASRAKAILASGVVDGIFLDWATDDRFAFFQTIRDSIGPDAIIYGNSNTTYRELLTPLMNGIFMEGLDSNTPTEWETIRDVVSRSQIGLREPKLISFEAWGNKNYEVNPQKEHSKMRATITLMMTQSNGYSIYYPDNSDTYNDHWHPWYDFYDVNVGAPKAVGFLQTDGSYRREFENGTVVYNPPLNAKDVTITFTENTIRKSTGEKGKTFKVPFYDGEIFFPESKSQSSLIKRAHTIFTLETPKPLPVSIEQKVIQKKFHEKLFGQFIWTENPILETRIFSMDGREIKNLNPRLDLISQPGVYFLKVRTQSASLIKKVIIP